MHPRSCCVEEKHAERLSQGQGILALAVEGVVDAVSQGSGSLFIFLVQNIGRMCLRPGGGRAPFGQPGIVPQLVLTTESMAVVRSHRAITQGGCATKSRQLGCKGIQTRHQLGCASAKTKFALAPTYLGFNRLRGGW